MTSDLIWEKAAESENALTLEPLDLKSRVTITR